MNVTKLIIKDHTMVLVWSIVVCLFVFSCQEAEIKSNNENGPTISEIKHIYSHYIKGNIKEYVKHIASCDSTSKMYVKNIIALHQTKLKTSQVECGKIDSIKICKIEKSTNKSHAKVYITHYYSNNTQEEILLQMVFKNNQWMIK